MEFRIRQVEKKDWNELLDWRNNELTRKMSISNDKVKKYEHYSYMEKMSQNELRVQYIFIHNQQKVGTIRIDKLNNGYEEFSYTINPLFRGKRYGTLMMELFLFDKNGKYRCEIKPQNTSSIKMVEKNGFTYRTSKEGLSIYLSMNS